MSNDLKTYLELLFRTTDSVYSGSLYGTEVITVQDLLNSEVSKPFICLNPLHPYKDFGNSAAPDTPRRADINVNRYQNFLFEIDNLELDKQLDILQNSGVPMATIVYSGGKSYHGIVSLVNPLAHTPHEKESIMMYKAIWSSIASSMETYAKSKGYMNSAAPLFDEACKNPSRLTRLPGHTREDTGKLQSLVSTGPLLSDEALDAILTKWTPQLRSIKTDKPEISAHDMESFRALLPEVLKSFLENPYWASDAGNYPTLFRLSLWVIDSTGVDLDTFLTYLHEKTFPYLLQKGYPSDKLERGVRHAFEMKGLK